MEMMNVKTHVLGRNAGGSLEFFSTEICLPRSSYDLGEHYDIAVTRAVALGFDSPFETFDEYEPAGKTLAAAYSGSSANQFGERVASLSIWDYDRDDGTPYRECEIPSDGFLDSHCCLMQLIEEARNLTRCSNTFLEAARDDVPHILVWVGEGGVEEVIADFPLNYSVVCTDTEFSDDDCVFEVRTGDVCHEVVGHTGTGTVTPGEALSIWNQVRAFRSESDGLSDGGAA